MKFFLLPVVSSVLVSLPLFAAGDCGSYATAEEIADCIVVEGSGADYEDWKANWDRKTGRVKAELAGEPGDDKAIVVYNSEAGC